VLFYFVKKGGTVRGLWLEFCYLIGSIHNYIFTFSILRAINILFMRSYWMLFVMCFSLSAVGQCVKCNSFAEARKKPEKVISIAINGMMHEAVDSVPPFIGEFVNLEFLYLTDQIISKIPNEIGKLTKLKELSFGGCQLTSIPDFIFDMTHLLEITIPNNQFTEEYKEELRKKFIEKMPNTKVMID
jgi:hypothetical protein